MHSMYSFINTTLENLHLHPHLLETATFVVIMTCRQQCNVQSNEEHSTPPTPNSPNHEHQGRIEAWF